jgi:glycosyltransferase involved in cell wall biosynthesis
MSAKKKTESYSQEKPLVTFALFAYNQEAYILKALEGVFSQTYSPLEILISDDCSADRTYQIIEQMTNTYRGPHKVTCSRNAKNLGIAEHVNKINSLANGELIVVAAGDDISIPGRTQRLVDEYLSSHKLANYFYSSAQQIGLDGTVMSVVKSPGAKNSTSKLHAALSPYPISIGATQAWTKLLVRAFAPLGSGVWAEDQVLGVRGLLLGPIRCVDEPLVHYRVGSGVSTRKKKFLIGKYFRGKIAGIGIYQQRCIDAWHVKDYFLSIIVATKVLVLTLIIPFDPVISLVKKLGKVITCQTDGP